LLFVVLLLGLAMTALAVTRRYCQEAYIDDCLNSVHCDYYSGSGYIGSIDINYNCPT
jgi:hypothetical protein